jgi:hypothetical protein
VRPQITDTDAQKTGRTIPDEFRVGPQWAYVLTSEEPYIQGTDLLGLAQDVAGERPRCNLSQHRKHCPLDRAGAVAHVGRNQQLDGSNRRILDG